MPFVGRRGSPLLLLLLALSLLVFSKVYPQALNGIRAGTADLFAPVLSAVSKPVHKASAFIRDVTGLAALQAENMHLRQENIRLREWYQTALLLDAENKSLKDLLNVKVEPQHSYITSQIIADAGNAYVKSLLVDAGSKDGVRKGQAVLSGDGLVGRIVESGKKASRVLLVTDINSRIPVLIIGTSQHAILAGTNEDFPVLMHLPPDSEVAEGARIITSGHGGLFPYGLPIGEVVIGSDGKRYVSLYADMDRMVYVRIVDKSGDPNLVRGQLQDKREF